MRVLVGLLADGTFRDLGCTVYLQICRPSLKSSQWSETH